MTKAGLPRFEKIGFAMHDYETNLHCSSELTYRQLFSSDETTERLNRLIVPLLVAHGFQDLLHLCYESQVAWFFMPLNITSH